SLAKNRRCCGRPAFSQGNLDAASKVGKHNVDLLSSFQCSSTPILFLEPSCWSMFVEDYRELKIENAEKIANRCFLFEQFVDDLLEHEARIHAKTRRTFAREESDRARYSLLRNGGRIRRARREIRSLPPSRPGFDRQTRESRARDTDHRVRDKLPPSNY